MFRIFIMGILKISDQMHENLRLGSSALSRSINAQAEHWLRIGMLAELYPTLNHADICRLLVRAEQDGGLDIDTVLAVNTPKQTAAKTVKARGVK